MNTIKSKWKSLSTVTRGIITSMFEVAVILIFMIVVIQLGGCITDPTSETLSIDSRLQPDSDGYYHLKLDSTKTQTLHRISGTAFFNGNPRENIKVHWYSTHYWLLSDTVGYVVEHWKYDDKDRNYRESIYVGRDTVYISYFEGMEVPTVNKTSYSNARGEINTMFAPVWWMGNDTVTIVGITRDDVKEIKIILE